MNNRTLLGLSLLTLSVSTGQAAMAAGEKCRIQIKFHPNAGNRKCYRIRPNTN